VAERRDRAPAETGRGVRDAIQYIPNPARPDDAFKAQQKLEFDRWRTAIAIVERMREAGISCELSNDLQNVHRKMAHAQ
jgi:hypothetical protein